MKEPLVFLYVVSASESHDEVTCHVPCLLPNGKIFFGSCKKTMRQHIKAHPELLHDNDLFLIGISGSKANKNGIRTRKILWAGKVEKSMTFKEAYETGYKDLKNTMNNEPLLHIKPTAHGYEYRDGSTHHKKHWQGDFQGKKPFDRDICFECKKLFFANGEGLELSGEILDTIKEHQIGKNSDIENAYYLFGRDSKGSAKGLRGSWLNINGKLVEKLVKLIEKNTQDYVDLHPVTRRIKSSCNGC